MEGNEGEVRGDEGESVGGSTLFLTSSASSEPLRAAQRDSQATLAESQLSGSARPK
jgi:hypothetical protein